MDVSLFPVNYVFQLNVQMDIDSASLSTLGLLKKNTENFAKGISIVVQ